MTVSATTSAQTLTAAIAEEVRALMGRRRISGAEMARRLGVSQMWVSDRLRATTAFTVTDLERIAGLLGVAVTELLPRRAFEVQSAAARLEADRTTLESPGATVQSLPVPGQRTPSTVRPVDTAAPLSRPRPNGVTAGQHLVTERPHDRRSPGRAPTSTPSPATRRPGVIRSHHGTMAR